MAHQRCREMQRQLAGGFWNFELKREVDLERYLFASRTKTGSSLSVSRFGREA